MTDERTSAEWVEEARSVVAVSPRAAAVLAGLHAFDEGLAADANPFHPVTEAALRQRWHDGWTKRLDSVSDRIRRRRGRTQAAITHPKD